MATFLLSDVLDNKKKLLFEPLRKGGMNICIQDDCYEYYLSAEKSAALYKIILENSNKGFLLTSDHYNISAGWIKNTNFEIIFVEKENRDTPMKIRFEFSELNIKTMITSIVVYQSELFDNWSDAVKENLKLLLD